jgi:hypothetical protein
VCAQPAGALVLDERFSACLNSQKNAVQCSLNGIVCALARRQLPEAGGVGSYCSFRRDGPAPGGGGMNDRSRVLARRTFEHIAGCAGVERNYG